MLNVPLSPHEWHGERDRSLGADDRPAGWLGGGLPGRHGRRVVRRRRRVSARHALPGDLPCLEATGSSGAAPAGGEEPRAARAAPAPASAAG